MPAPEIERFVVQQIRSCHVSTPMPFARRRLFTQLDNRWDTLDAEEQRRILHVLISRIDYDGSQQTITIAFKQTGIETLMAETRAAEVV